MFSLFRGCRAPTRTVTLMPRLLRYKEQRCLPAILLRLNAPSSGVATPDTRLGILATCSKLSGMLRAAGVGTR